MNKQVVVIAGGTGLIGRELERYLSQSNYNVLILTRNPKKDNHIFWNPDEGILEISSISNANFLINLSGEGIADKRWSEKRKRELISSRVNSTHLLAKKSQELTNLKKYIGASGINCYGYESIGKEFVEEDAYSDDFVAQLVKKWENASASFRVPIVSLRTAVVLTEREGAIDKMSIPIRKGLGSFLGNGQQPLQWIHIEDVLRAYLFFIETELSGAYNLSSGNTTNSEITKELAKKLNKKIKLPNIPRWLIRLMFGEMSTLLLEGVNVSNQKLIATGFQLKYTNLKEAIRALDLK